jgi:hypothetical protein
MNNWNFIVELDSVTSDAIGEPLSEEVYACIQKAVAYIRKLAERDALKKDRERS